MKVKAVNLMISPTKAIPISISRIQKHKTFPVRAEDNRHPCHDVESQVGYHRYKCTLYPVADFEKNATNEKPLTANKKSIDN